MYFHRLVTKYITPTTTPYRFAYWPKWSKGDAVLTAIHSDLTFMDKKETLDHSGLQHVSAQLDTGLFHRKTTSSLGWQQHINIIPLSLGAPRGCVRSPLFVALLTHYVQKHIPNLLHLQMI